MFSRTVNEEDNNPENSSEKLWKTSSPSFSWNKLEPIKEVEETDVQSPASSSGGDKNGTKQAAPSGLDAQSLTSTETYRTPTGNGTPSRVSGAFDLSSISSFDRLSFRTAIEGDLEDFDETTQSSNPNIHSYSNGFRTAKPGESVSMRKAPLSKPGSSRITEISCTHCKFSTVFTKPVGRFELSVFALVLLVLTALLIWGIGALVVEYQEKVTVKQEWLPFSGKKITPFPNIFLCHTTLVKLFEKQGKYSLFNDLWKVALDNLVAGSSLFEKCFVNSIELNCSEIVKPINENCFRIKGTNQSVYEKKSFFVMKNSSSTSLMIYSETSTAEHILPEAANYKAVFLEHGTFTEISMQPIKRTLLKNCVGKEGIEFFTLEENYSAENCRLDCQLSQHLKCCNCIPASIPRDALKTQLFNDGSLSKNPYCAINVSCSHFNTIPASDADYDSLQFCFKKCKPLCNGWLHAYDVKTAPLSAGFLEGFDNINSSRLTILQMQMEGVWDSYLHDFEESAFSVVQFCSSLGGLLFLWFLLTSVLMIFIWLAMGKFLNQKKEAFTEN